MPTERATRDLRDAFAHRAVTAVLIAAGVLAVFLALSLGSQLVLGVRAGTLGVMFASPLTVVGLLLIERFYVEDVLEADAK